MMIEIFKMREMMVLIKTEPKHNLVLNSERLTKLNGISAFRSTVKQDYF